MSFLLAATMLVGSINKHMARTSVAEQVDATSITTAFDTPSNETSQALTRRLQSSECVVPYTESACRADARRCTFWPAGLASSIAGTNSRSSASCICTIHTHCPGSSSSFHAGSYTIQAHIPGCRYQNDGTCDEGSRCPYETDPADCYQAPPPPPPPEPPPPPLTFIDYCRMGNYCDDGDTNCFGEQPSTCECCDLGYQPGEERMTYHIPHVEGVQCIHNEVDPRVMDACEAPKPWWWEFGYWALWVAGVCACCCVLVKIGEHEEKAEAQRLAGDGIYDNASNPVATDTENSAAPTATQAALALGPSAPVRDIHPNPYEPTEFQHNGDASAQVSAELAATSTLAQGSSALYAPPIANQEQSTTAASPQSLAAFLAEQNLSQYEAALRE